MMFRKDILLLLLGWLLGIFSPILVDMINRRSQRKEIKQGLLTELKETKFRLVATVCHIALKFGIFDRELFNWIRLHYEENSGTYPRDRMLQSIENLLKSNDEQLAKLAQLTKAPAGNVLSLKTFNLSFFDSQIGKLSLFDFEFQNRTLEIKTQINSLNEDIELSKFYFEKTFDSTVSDENHVIISKNLENCYRDVSDKARRIADYITKLLPQ